MTRHRDLLYASLGAVGCALVALVAPFDPLRAAGAVPLALALPGFAIAAASFGPRLPDGPVLVMLSLGLSLSVLAVGSVILHLLPGRFGELSWAVFLVALVAAACAVAARRRGDSPPPSLPAPRVRRPPLVAAIMLGAGAAALAGTVLLASRPLPADEAVGYTRLWMLPSDPGTTPPHVRVGVVNQEGEPVVYRLAIRTGGRRTIRRMDLEAGEQRIWRVTDPRARPGDAIPATARLFRAEDPETIYRRVNGWIPGA